MPTCQDCENYQPKNENEGYCCGERIVECDQPVDLCPENEYTPKKGADTKETPL